MVCNKSDLNFYRIHIITKMRLLPPAGPQVLVLGIHFCYCYSFGKTSDSKKILKG